MWLEILSTRIRRKRFSPDFYKVIYLSGLINCYAVGKKEMASSDLNGYFIVQKGYFEYWVIFIFLIYYHFASSQSIEVYKDEIMDMGKIPLTQLPTKEGNKGKPPHQDGKWIGNPPPMINIYG